MLAAEPRQLHGASSGLRFNPQNDERCTSQKSAQSGSPVVALHRKESDLWPDGPKAPFSATCNVCVYVNLGRTRCYPLTPPLHRRTSCGPCNMCPAFVEFENDMDGISLATGPLFFRQAQIDSVAQGNAWQHITPSGSPPSGRYNHAAVLVRRC